MFDTMVFTKVLGAFCGALLVFLLLQWASYELYRMPNATATPALAFDTGADAPAEDAAPVVQVSFEEAFAMADAAAGARIWNQCRACHAMEPGRNGVGPYLHGVVNRPVGAAEGFRAYSGALNAATDVWTPEALSDFIENPRRFAPGTSMVFNGISDLQARVNLIAYMEQQSQ